MFEFVEKLYVLFNSFLRIFLKFLFESFCFRFGIFLFWRLKKWVCLLFWINGNFMLLLNFFFCIGVNLNFFFLFDDFGMFVLWRFLGLIKKFINGLWIGFLFLIVLFKFDFWIRKKNINVGIYILLILVE